MWKTDYKIMQSHTNTHSYRKWSYLWITEPKVETPKVGEKAKASEENPVLESGNRREKGKKLLRKYHFTMFTISVW